MTDSTHTLASALRTVVWQAVRRQADGTYALTHRNPESVVQALTASAQSYAMGRDYDSAGHEHDREVLRELSAALALSGLAWLQSGIVGDPGRIVPLSEAETVKAAEEAVMNKFREQLGISQTVSGEPS